MNIEKKYICIVCPNSCRLTVTDDGKTVRVSGASCKRGIEHGKSEYIKPVRMLTTTVSIKGGIHRRISVISDREIPKDKIEECLSVLYRTQLQAPVRAGEVVVKNICKTGADMLASRTMKKKE